MSKSAERPETERKRPPQPPKAPVSGTAISQADGSA